MSRSAGRANDMSRKPRCAATPTAPVDCRWKGRDILRVFILYPTSDAQDNGQKCSRIKPFPRLGRGLAASQLRGREVVTPRTSRSQVHFAPG